MENRHRFMISKAILDFLRDFVRLNEAMLADILRSMKVTIGEATDLIMRVGTLPSEAAPADVDQILSSLMGVISSDDVIHQRLNHTLYGVQRLNTAFGTLMQNRNSWTLESIHEFRNAVLSDIYLSYSTTEERVLFYRVFGHPKRKEPAESKSGIPMDSIRVDDILIEFVSSFSRLMEDHLASVQSLMASTVQAVMANAMEIDRTVNSPEENAEAKELMEKLSTLAVNTMGALSTEDVMIQRVEHIILAFRGIETLLNYLLLDYEKRGTSGKLEFMLSDMLDFLHSQYTSEDEKNEFAAIFPEWKASA